MSRMANVLKRASRQAKKQLYQSVGETEGALKGKPGRKNKCQKRALSLEFLKGRQLIPWRSRNNNCKKRITRPQYSSYANGTTFPLRRRDVLLNNV